MLNRILSVLILSALAFACGDDDPMSGYDTEAIIASEKSVTISAGSYYDIPITVDLTTMVDPVLKADFTSSGDTGSGISVLVTDDLGLADWALDESYAALYEVSGAEDEFELDIAVSGTYHVIYSNSDTTEARSVTTSISLFYDINGS